MLSRDGLAQWSDTCSIASVIDPMYYAGIGLRLTTLSNLLEAEGSGYTGFSDRGSEKFCVNAIISGKFGVTMKCFYVLILIFCEKIQIWSFCV